MKKLFNKSDLAYIRHCLARFRHSAACTFVARKTKLGSPTLATVRELVK